MTPGPATPDAATAVAEWRSLRSEHVAVKEKLQRARNDNTRLLHELKAYRRQLDGSAAALQDAAARRVEFERLQTRLAAVEMVRRCLPAYLRASFTLLYTLFTCVPPRLLSSSFSLCLAALRPAVSGLQRSAQTCAHRCNAPLQELAQAVSAKREAQVALQEAARREEKISTNLGALTQSR